MAVRVIMPTAIGEQIQILELTLHRCLTFYEWRCDYLNGKIENTLVSDNIIGLRRLVDP